MSVADSWFSTERSNANVNGKSEVDFSGTWLAFGLGGSLYDIH